MVAGSLACASTLLLNRRTPQRELLLTTVSKADLDPMRLTTGFLQSAIETAMATGPLR